MELLVLEIHVPTKHYLSSLLTTIFQVYMDTIMKKFKVIHMVS